MADSVRSRSKGDHDQEGGNERALPHTPAYEAASNSSGRQATWSEFDRFVEGLVTWGKIV